MYTDYIGSEPRCCAIAKKLIWCVAAICCTGGAVDATGVVAHATAMTAPFMSKAQVAPKRERAPIPAGEVAMQERSGTTVVAAPVRLASNPFAIGASDVSDAPALPVAPLAPSETPAATEVSAPAAEVAPSVVETRAPVAETPAPVAETPVPVFALAPVPAAKIAAAVPAQSQASSQASIGPLLSSTPFKLAAADPHFEAALTAIATKPGAEVEIRTEAAEEEIPTVPFAGRKQLRSSEPAAPAADTAKPAATVAAVDLTPTISLPQVVDFLPRPRPPLTPAQELGLEGKERAKAEKCLANAIYFEARNEPVRGQIAVAQVVLNRVFSPYYPETICGVVYQNAHRRLACQFTFACDGIPDIVREKGPWQRAQRIAKQALDSQNWLPEVAKATHYHATYVKPRWIRDMRKIVKHGQHIFYRPWNWGNGEDEAGWGVASLTHSTPGKTKTARN